MWQITGRLLVRYQTAFPATDQWGVCQGCMLFMRIASC